MTSVIRTAVALALSVLFLSISADPAQALLDIPTSDRRALQIADLAGSSGVARPADLAVMPLDDSVFLESYQSLNNRGLDDQLGAQVAGWAETRADGRFHFEFLRPDPGGGQTGLLLVPVPRQEKLTQIGQARLNPVEQGCQLVGSSGRLH